MKEPVRTLVLKAAVNDFAGKGCYTRTVLRSFAGQAAQYACQTRGSPAVAAAPEVAVAELPLAIVPDVRQQLLFRVPEPLPVALDLRESLVIKAHRRQKGRRGIEAVGPHFGRAENVIENAFPITRSAFPNPGE